MLNVEEASKSNYDGIVYVDVVRVCLKSLFQARYHQFSSFVSKSLSKKQDFRQVFNIITYVDVVR